MINNIILASSSPRRKEILESAGIDFEIVVKEADEIVNDSLENHDKVVEIAITKAKAVYEIQNDRLVLGADTMVFLDDLAIGKAKSIEEAKKNIMMLSNKVHQVITGIAVFYDGRLITAYDITDVEFKELSEEEVDEYLATGEYLGKAGSYAIQGLASKFVKEINGSMTNVVGLPIELVLQILHDLD